MRKSDGMFDGHIPQVEIEHAIPEDDFEHIEAMDCPCNPEFKAIRWVGRAIVHQNMEMTCPDTIPEWMEAE